MSLSFYFAAGTNWKLCRETKKRICISHISI